MGKKGGRILSERFEFNMSEEMVAALDAAATWDDTTVSAYVRRAVADALREDGFGKLLDGPKLKDLKLTDLELATAVGRLRKMPSSLNDALRSMEVAADLLERLKSK